MSLSRENKIYKSFVISVSLTIILVFSGFFLGLNLKTRQLIMEQNLIHARALFSSIVLARKWNALYDGVYVRKGPGVATNPYLTGADIVSRDGTVYTKRNPAIMTREISEIAEKDAAFRFHMTSLQLLNPENAPDAFEKTALERLDRGEREFHATEQNGDRMIFRYFAPLYVEKSCLTCHGGQGYRTGDVRGGISISFDIENTRRKLKETLILIILFSTSTTVSLLGLIYYFTARLIRKVSEARRHIELMAITDGLTGLHNRRHGLERFGEELDRARRRRTSLSCLIFDIDHFKQVNDTHGHLAGDKVLKEVGRRLLSELRSYDVACRYGGEEFLVVLPETEFPDATAFAERIREVMRTEPVHGIGISVSIGVTRLRGEDNTADDLVRRADAALYRAKENGRDRVVTA